MNGVEGLPSHPLIYEINTWPWLAALSAAAGRRLDLASIPDAIWDGLHGYDAVWLMGVWQRSPAGVSIAMRNRGLVASFEAALPDYVPADVVGSPYCVRDYVVDPALGGTAGLAVAREALAQRGLDLILDFVPNHVAPDHAWVTQHPGRFVQGTRDDLRDDPNAFIEVSGNVLANGRDPYSGAWPDVVQLNAFSDDLRAAAADTLRTIADQCDGVRCDMAMLMMNDSFARTWGQRVGEPPNQDYWPEVIAAVRETHATFRFMAEAYWDLEWALQQQGFDYCYDKRLYDRLIHEGGEQIRLHLSADTAYEERLLRFVENHDEPRAASVFTAEQHRAAAVVALTQAGARLVHHGQTEGWRTHLPVFLGRYPSEIRDDDLAAFYESLLAALGDPTFHHGLWRLCERWGWAGNEDSENIVAWSWEGDSRWLVAVNLSDRAAAAMIRAPWDDVRGRRVRLVDPTNDLCYVREGDDLRDGMYVELGPWRWHLFRIEPEDDP